MESWDVKVVVIDILSKSVTFTAFRAIIGKVFEIEYWCRLCLFQKTPHNVPSILYPDMSFSWRVLLCVSIPFFLMMVVKGIIEIAIPIISTIELLTKVGTKLIGVNIKLWFHIE